MGYRRLGQTDIEITAVGLGVMQFARGRGLLGRLFPRLAAAQEAAIVRAAVEGGINWFDTAAVYGRGQSERGLAAALHAAGQSDAQVVVASKWWPLLRTARDIGRTIDERLRALDGYSLDLYMVHQPFGLSSIEAEMAAMAALVAAGRVRAVGVSNFGAAAMRRAQRALARWGLPLAANEVHYSLLHRRIEHNGVLAAAKELGVTIIAYTPPALGPLSRRYRLLPDLLNPTRLPPPAAVAGHPLHHELATIAARLSARVKPVTPAQVALSWLLHAHGETVVAIPGAATPQQAAAHAQALRLSLTAAEVARLDRLSRPPA